MPTYILPRQPIPVDALRLNEDIVSLRLAAKILRNVDAYNVTDDPNKDELWLIIGKLTIMTRHAEAKMRKQFLDPRKKRLNETKGRLSKAT